ncbi:MAG: HisS family protein [archaeon]
METVKGFNDYTGQEAIKREKITEVLVKNFRLYGFEPAEAPIIEYEEFVKGDNQNDEAVSDIYKLKDKGARNLALRYEVTFQLKRLAKNKKLPYKRYQIGPVFRDEPSSSNRVRQFTQCDVDTVGSSAKDEAEILALTQKIFKELKIQAEIQVNSRKLLNSVIKSLGIDNTEFVLREIDKLDKQGEDNVKQSLSKFIEKPKIIKLFKALSQSLSSFKKFEGYKELKEVFDLCELYKVKVVFKPTLARGLSYYNGTVFEAKTREFKETLGGGGSYMINNTQSTGISFGIERISQLSKLDPENEKILIISIKQDKKAILLAEKLRKQGKSVIISDKITKALEYANSYNISQVIFLGEKEIKSKKYKIKDMKTGKELLVSEKELVEKLKN